MYQNKEKPEIQVEKLACEAAKNKKDWSHEWILLCSIRLTLILLTLSEEEQDRFLDLFEKSVVGLLKEISKGVSLPSDAYETEVVRIKTHYWLKNPQCFEAFITNLKRLVEEK